MILSFFAFSFYLVISICTAIITITSVDTSPVEFDRLTHELSQKSGYLLEGLNSFSFLFSNNPSFDEIVENRHEISRLINVAPYIFGFNSSSNVILCSNLDFKHGNKSISIAYLNFKRAIPVEIPFNYSEIQKFNSNCQNFYSRFVQGKNNYKQGLYDVFAEYDVFISIAPEIMHEFLDIQKLNTIELNNQKSKTSFAQLILKSWKLKAFNGEYVLVGIKALKHKAIKLNFADQDLNKILLNSDFSLKK
jgi:hypothetical protein